MSAPLSERSETDSEAGLKGHASKRVAQIEVLAGLLSTNDVWIALEPRNLLQQRECRRAPIEYSVAADSLALTMFYLCGLGSVP